MRSFTTLELTYLQNRIGYSNHVLFWVEPRNRSTNARVPMGFWTGEEDATFTIGGQARLYQGGGALQDVDVLMGQIGMLVRNQNLIMSPLHPDTELLLRGHDPFRAPAQLHIAMFTPNTGALVAEPWRAWKGLLHTSTIQTPAIGGEASAPISLTSAADDLTVGMTATRSDAFQKLRGGDRFFQYKDVAARYSWGA